ncbi:MAG TPA: Hsp20/alpha crystallin family protein [Phycisphaerae bacterium]|nr:Hsp20/alpha crystallin family protein [Phycisphaerae bacterium]
MTDQTPHVEKREKDVPEGVEHLHEGKLFIPPADIVETDSAVLVKADMPGAGAEQVDVTLEQDVLTIHARVGRHDPEGYGLAYSEYETGDYQRVFSLSAEIDADHIDAKISAGVLTLTLPKAKPAQKQIRVQAH